METSEYNRLPQVVETLDFADDVFIVDSTIRSLQSGVSGSRHTANDLIEIGKALDELGVRELIVNLSWKDGLEVCEGLAKENLRCKVVGTFGARDPSWKQLADDGVRAGVDEICFTSIPDAEYLKRAADLIRSQGRNVSHAFAEVCSYQEVVDLCREGVQYGYASQSLQESFLRYGIAPEAIKFLVKSIRADVPECPPLYVHLHNFYGQATMTSVAALVAGASAADVCMNAIGHHCGHTSLSEVVMTLEGLYGINTGIKLDQLKEVSLFIRERTGIPLPVTKPIVGDFAFTTDGAWWAAEADLPYERRVHARFPSSPDMVGAEEHVIWSDKTITLDGVKTRLASMGLTAKEGDVEQITKLLGKVLGEKRDYPNWMLDSDFEKLCRAIITSEADTQSA